MRRSLRRRWRTSRRRRGAPATTTSDEWPLTLSLRVPSVPACRSRGAGRCSRGRMAAARRCPRWMRTRSWRLWKSAHTMSA
jgi:hypothetical protein